MNSLVKKAGIVLLAACVSVLYGCAEERDMSNLMLNEQIIDEQIIDEQVVGDFSLTVILDKTEAKIGDTVTATVVFRNLSGRDIEAELTDYVAAGGGQSKEDILEAVFLPEGVVWVNELFGFRPRPKILIESGAVIERKFEYVTTSSGDLEARARASFFPISSTATNPFGTYIYSNPIKIKVQ